jgi:hypothetical protein
VLPPRRLDVRVLFGQQAVSGQDTDQAGPSAPRCILRCGPARAQALAELRLRVDPDDVNALFAMTLSLGMQADYASLIEKHQMESLGMIRDADKFAKRLLAVNPDAADAYLALGAANYIIGSLPALKRFFLHFKGISGDKRGGLQQLEIAASRGPTCGRLPRFSWRWRRCARRRQHSPAFNWKSWSRSFQRIRSFLGS